MVAGIVGLVLAAGAGGCSAPDPEAFPMPDAFVGPYGPYITETVPARSCPAVEAIALELDPESGEWYDEFQRALRIAAGRTLVDNPQLDQGPHIDTLSEAASQHPWSLQGESWEIADDDEIWARACDGDGDEAAQARLTDLVHGTNVAETGRFSAAVLQTVEPAWSPYEARAELQRAS